MPRRSRRSLAPPGLAQPPTTQPVQTLTTGAVPTLRSDRRGTRFGDAIIWGTNAFSQGQDINSVFNQLRDANIRGKKGELGYVLREVAKLGDISLLNPPLASWYDAEIAYMGQALLAAKEETAEAIKKLKASGKDYDRRDIIKLYMRYYPRWSEQYARKAKELGQKERYQAKLEAWRAGQEAIKNKITVNVYEIETQRGTKKIEAVDEDQAKEKAEDLYGLKVSNVSLDKTVTLTAKEATKRITTAKSRGVMDEAQALKTYGSVLGVEIPGDSVPIRMGKTFQFVSRQDADSLKTLPLYDQTKGDTGDKLSAAFSGLVSALEKLGPYINSFVTGIHGTVAGADPFSLLKATSDEVEQANNALQEAIERGWSCTTTIQTFKVVLSDGTTIYIEALDSPKKSGIDSAKQKAIDAGYTPAWVTKADTTGFNYEDSIDVPTLIEDKGAKNATEILENAGVDNANNVTDSYHELKNYDAEHGTDYAGIWQREGVAAVQEALQEGSKALDALEDYKTEDGYNLLKARLDGVTPEQMATAGFDKETVDWVEESYQTSLSTGVALPGDKKWENVLTGKVYSDAQFKELITNFEGGDRSVFDTHPTNICHLTDDSARRLLIEGTSALFFAPTMALLPEVKASDIKPITWAVGGAQLAMWAMPFIPKGVLPYVSTGAAGIFGYSTAQNWQDLSPAQKALAVTGTTLVALPALVGIVRGFGPAAVKIPTKDGGQIVVWRGIQVNGKPIFGISQGKPTIGGLGIQRPSYAQVASATAGMDWHPVTKTETTLLGTTSALRKMGASADDIARVQSVWGESVPTFARKAAPIKVEPTELLAGSQRLTPDEITTILRTSLQRWAKKIKMIYGSSTMRPQLKEALRNWRQWHDLDIQTSMTASEVSQYVDDLVNALKKGGTRVRVNPENPGVIEKFTEGAWHKITDIHAADVSPISPATAEGAYGWLYAEKPITIKLPGVGKLKIMTLSETGLRKGGSITSFQVDRIAPAAHRINDIADFYVILLNYKGSDIANKFAQAFGYSPKQLAEAFAKNPSKWSSWSLSPSAGAAKGIPSVSITVPPSFKSSIPASLVKSIESPSSIAGATSYAVSVSPLSVKSVSPSGKISPSVMASPSPSPSPSISISPSASVSASISISPSPSPSLSPSVSVSPYPSPSPSPSPYPSPSPSPYPYPSGSPGPQPRPILTAVGGKKYYKIPSGSIAWKMGAVWKYIPPPWTQAKPITLKHPPKGATKLGNRTPEDTIQMIGKVSGKKKIRVPKSASIDLGVVDIRISDYGKSISFTGKGLETVAGGSIADPAKGMSVPATKPMKVKGYSKLAFGTTLRSLTTETYTQTIPKDFAEKALSSKLKGMKAKEIAKEIKESKVSPERREEILKMLPDRVRREVELWEGMEVEYAPIKRLPRVEKLPPVFRRGKKKKVVPSAIVG